LGQTKEIKTDIPKILLHTNWVGVVLPPSERWGADKFRGDPIVGPRPKAWTKGQRRKNSAQKTARRRDPDAG